MNYSINPSPFTTTETLVSMSSTASVSDVVRGRELATALGGRWSIRLRGHLFPELQAGRKHLHLSLAEKWRTLFEGGWRAESSFYRGSKCWAFTLDGRRSYRLSEAINSTRRMIQTFGSANPKFAHKETVSNP